MPQKELGSDSAHPNRTSYNLLPNAAPEMSEDDVLADVDEPPDLQRTPRPSVLKLHESFKSSFMKHTPRCERKQSLLSTALHSNNTSPVEEYPYSDEVRRSMSCTSTWSNNSVSTAELTSDGGITSPGTRTSTPSPPPPAFSSHNLLPISNKPLEQPFSIVRHDDENTSPFQKLPPAPSSGEHKVEAGLGRKRCITFACGGKNEPKSEPEPAKTIPGPQQQTTEPPKRTCTIKFACPTKISTDAPAKAQKLRVTRAASPAPPPRPRTNPKPTPPPHRGSDSTVRNPSPVSVRKTRTADRSRRLSSNSDLARTEAFRFHEFASSEEEVDEWTQESTCHRRPLTIKDTLIIENNLRQLGEEAEEEALDDEDEEDNLEDDEDELDDEEDKDIDDLDEDEDEQDSDAHDISSDEGFQTDNEEGFAVSDDESDVGSDYNWWTPGRSTAATSIEHLDLIRHSSGPRSASASSVGSVESHHRYMPENAIKRRKSQPVCIRVPSPELPDSTDFVCGTLDEDRPLEEAYMSVLERRRQAKHKKTPQDVDPTFPTSDPEMDEEDEDDEPDHLASESDQHVMVHGQMDAFDGDLRGRRKSIPAKRSPAQSPKRLRSPPPTKRAVHRSSPPRKLFGQSPKRIRSPAPVRLRSPSPTRRGSSYLIEPKRTGLSIQFAGLAERSAPMTTSSLPRTSATHVPPELNYDDEDTPNEFPVRRAIDIKVGLEKKRQRRKEQLYKKHQKKNAKDKRPAPGKGCERMREVGLGLAAHKGKATGFAAHMTPTPDQKDMHVLSV